MQDLIDKAKYFGSLSKDGIPHNDKGFMMNVPNCEFGDEKGVKLRIAMYKAFIEAWTKKNLSQDIDGYMEDISNIKVTVKKVSAQ